MDSQNLRGAIIKLRLLLPGAFEGTKLLDSMREILHLKE